MPRFLPCPQSKTPLHTPQSLCATPLQYVYLNNTNIPGTVLINDLKKNVCFTPLEDHFQGFTCTQTVPELFRVNVSLPKKACDSDLAIPLLMS